MKKILFAGGLTAAALAVVGFNQAAGGMDTLKSHMAALNKAESVKATYTVQPVGGAATSYSVQLAKPNLAKIEKPNTTIILDGTNIWFYDKKDNSYYKKAATAASINGLFATEELAMWQPFFNADAIKGIGTAKALPNKTRKGVEFKVVEATLKGKDGESVTFYINPTDSIARQAELTSNLDGQKTVRLVDTKSLELNKANDATLYAWNPPADSKEIREEDMITDTWYTDLDEAKAMAKKTNRMVLVDFYADW